MPARTVNPRAAARRSTARDVRIDDVLVFERTEAGFTLVGGSGRGEGWAGIVELTTPDDGAVGRAWRRGTTEEVSSTRFVQVAGPYYARHAMAVPVGQSHVVVFGARRAIDLRDSELVQLAVRAVTDGPGISADKLLADELEVVHALRALMAYRPMTVRDTARHIATVAAQALSCEVAVISVALDGRQLVEGLDFRSGTALAKPDPGRQLSMISKTAMPLIEQVAAPEPDIFGVDVASRMTLPLGGETDGALALGHTVARARGFTSLCQRIGRAIVEAAELLLTQAQTREQLATERDLLESLVRTDPLTGVGNQRAWEDAVAAMRSAPGNGGAFVVCCDLDGLKVVNDRFGHSAGDAVIRGAANLLSSSTRDSDLVVRVGGDEFVVLLRPADPAAARRVVSRIRRAQRGWRVTEHGLTPLLSLGSAPVADGDLEAARVAADRSMYEDKRRWGAKRIAQSVALKDRRSAAGRARDL